MDESQGSGRSKHGDFFPRYMMDRTQDRNMSLTTFVDGFHHDQRFHLCRAAMLVLMEPVDQSFQEPSVVNPEMDNLYLYSCCLITFTTVF